VVLATKGLRLTSSRLDSPSRIEQICRSLARCYRSPRLGNKCNPLDELVYIILSTRSRSQGYQGLYRAVKRAYPRWEGLAEKRQLGGLARILEPGGLSRLKAGQVTAIVRTLRQRFGYATLSPLRYLDDAAAEEFLVGLPGVGKKVAKCVLMYSLGRKVLPVDVHVHRVAQRLGMRTKRRPDTSQDLIEAQVPPHLRYGFHVNAIAHGRAACLPRFPRCGDCCISRWCRYLTSTTR